MNTLDFEDWVEFVIEDPTKLTRSGYPTHQASVYVFVDRSWNDMNNDHSRPQSQQVDDAIVHITADYVEARKLSNGAGKFTRWVCGNCGSGLQLDHCPGCDHAFRDNAVRMGATMPMPRKLAAFLQDRGHEFGQDPEVVWQQER